jgi:hypothetical protein
MRAIVRVIWATAVLIEETPRPADQWDTIIIRGRKRGGSAISWSCSFRAHRLVLHWRPGPVEARAVAETVPADGFR